MAFDAYRVSIELIKELRPVVERLEGLDRNLADQLRRGASSISLNLAEGRRKSGKSRTNFFRIAAGSANEVRATLEVAQAWGYTGALGLEAASELLDRELAMLWKLARPLH